MIFIDSCDWIMDLASPNINLRIDGKKSPQKSKNPKPYPKPPPPTTTLVDFPPLPSLKSAPPPKETHKTTLLIGTLAVSAQPPSSPTTDAQALSAVPIQPPQAALAAAPSVPPRPGAQAVCASTSRSPRPAPRASPAAPSDHRTAPAAGPTTGAVPALKDSFGSKMVKAYKGTFDFKPLHRLQGIPCLSFYDVDKDILLSKVQFIVVVKFSHNRPKYVDFRVFLENKKFDKGFKVVEFDKKHVFVVFECFHDFVKLWIMRSVLIKGFKARFFCWDEHFNPCVESFIAPIWIHLPGLPLFMFDEEVVLSIGALFGKTLFIDPACLRKDKIGVLSLCVSMDVRNKKLDEFWVEFIGEGIKVTRFLQRVVYGDIPPFCSSCKHLGHFSESCKILEARDLRDKLEGKKVMQEVDGNDRVIPTVSVFKRLGVLSVPTSGKDLGESSTALGRNLEEGTVEDITNEEEFDFENQNSATIAVKVPSLEPLFSLGGDNGKKTLGVLENRVENLQLSSRFEAIAAGDPEILAVENGSLQEISANCDESATLIEDISQLKKDMQVIPSATDSLPGNIQEAEENLAKSQNGCSESEFENGIFMQSAAETVEEATLRDHNSTSRDIQPMILGVPESSLEELQNDADLDLIVPDSEDISDPEDVSSSFAGSTFNGHNSCSEDDTELILGPTESQEDNLQLQPILDLKGTAGSVLLWLARKVFVRVLDCLYPSESGGISLDFAKQVLHKVCIIQGITPTIADHQDKGVKQVQNMLVNKHPYNPVDTPSPSTKVVIKHHSSSNASKDISVFDDLVYPVITVISEDEACTGTYIPRHSRLHPSYKERSSKVNSLDYLDLHEVWATKRKDTDTMGKELFETPYKAPTSPTSLADEALLVTPSSSGIPKAVSSSATKDQTGEALQPVLYSKEELAAKIMDKLNLSRYEEMQIELHNVVQQQIDKLGKRCPWNDRAVNIIVDWYINAMIWNTPDKKPPKDYQDYLRSIKKDKIRKDMIEPASQVKSDYNLRSKIKTQRKDSSYTKFFKENFVPP